MGDERCSRLKEVVKARRRGGGRFDSGGGEWGWRGSRGREQEEFGSIPFFYMRRYVKTTTQIITGPAPPRICGEGRDIDRGYRV